jgi:signal transduction histidine kinase
VSFEQHFSYIKKYFKVEIVPINSDNTSLGTLFLLKDITQHKQDMETIKNNQDVLMERERLASLGQLIGGIAHNLKTPIMSVAGATEGLEELIKEYDESIDDPLVNSQDHHEIAKEMESWIPKIRAHIEYMSDIITTVKGQAVALSNEKDISFTVGDLVKRVNILMKHELKNAYIYLNVLMKTDEELTLKGDVNALVQIVNNMITNAIQAYKGVHDQNIELEVSKKGNEVIFSVTDFAGGLPQEVQEKLFKEMVTTKGKNGTGLGLYMSYSNIRARFGGDITYKTEQGKGTTFNIIIPMDR